MEQWQAVILGTVVLRDSVNWSVKTGIIVRGERTRTVAVCGTVAGSDTRNSCTEGQCELECKDRN